MWKKTYNNEQTRIRKIITGITGILFLFYVVSCSSEGDTSSPSPNNADSTPPSAVRNLKVDSSTDTQVVLSWTAPTNTGTTDGTTPATLSGYVVKYKRTADSEFTEIDETGEGVRLATALTGTTATVIGLDANTSYTFLVVAVNSADAVGVDEDAPTVDQTTAPALPGQVEDLTVSDPSYNEESNASGFKVTWTAPTDTGISTNGDPALITGYQVVYTEVDDALNHPSVTNVVTTTEQVFTGLKPNAKYEIRIRAQTVLGEGTEKSIFGWTPSLPGAVDPDSILFTRATSSTIRIKWSAPEQGRAGGASDDITTTLYKVEMSSNNGQSYTLIQDDYSNPVIFASNLSKSTTYRARITAKNKWGEVVSVSTATGATVEQDSTPPSAVRLLEVDSLTDTQVVLSWTAPSDPGTTNGTTPAILSNYVVKYKKTADSEFIEIDENSVGVRLTASLTGTSTTATVTGLEANTSYTFLVVAVNSADAVGVDEDAPTVEQTTAPAPPGSLRKINTCPKATSVDLAWDVSPGATSYKLYRDDAEIANIPTTNYTNTGLTPRISYTYKVQACSTAGCSTNTILEVTTSRGDRFESIIEIGRTPTALNGYDERSREIFSRYDGNTPLVAKYLKPGGSGSKDGSSFDDAAGDLKAVLEEEITDASASKVYVVLMAGGNYTSGDSVSMKNHVAIIGGVGECLVPSDMATYLNGENSYRVFHNNNNGLDKTALLYGVTVTNGRADYGGGMRNVFSSPTLVGVTFSGNTVQWSGGGIYNIESSPSLTKVTFSENTAYEGGGMHNNNSSPSLTNVAFSNNTGKSGGGMYNSSSSPSLYQVIFSGNTAELYGGGIQNYQSSPSLRGVAFFENKSTNGGGIYNQKSSPNLLEVTFSKNKANERGGGMYNNDNSSPSLEGVTFSNNTAADGGGMYNEYDSSPSLVGVTFSGNTATNGGGMYNRDSSPSLRGVTFSENTATSGGGMYDWYSSSSLVGVTFFENTATSGGGMYNNNGLENNGVNTVGPLIINGIFWGNIANTGPQFYFHNAGNGEEKLRIYNSIVAGGTGTLKGVYNSINQGGFVSGGGSAPVAISFSNIINADPRLSPLANNGGAVWTHAITSTSPAANQGLYVKKSGTTFYYRADGTDWYTEPDLSGDVAAVPNDAKDLTATDATGYTRTGRPDLGAYEAR